MRNRFSDAFSAHERLRIDCAVAAGKSWFPWLSVGEGDGVVHQNYTEWRKNRPVTLVKAILEYWQLSIGGVHFNQTAEIEVMYELESALLSLYAVKDAEAEVDHPAGCNQQHR